MKKPPRRTGNSTRSIVPRPGCHEQKHLRDMTALFKIDVAWPEILAACAYSPEEAYLTVGNIRITANDICLTRCHEKRSDRIKDGPLLSLYPMALWLCGVWWRILYEPRLSDDILKEPLDWRMSHELASIGEGYIWPPLQFASDGQNLSIRFQHRSDDAQARPVEYLGATMQTIPLEAAFEGFSRCVVATLSRLESRSFWATELHKAWVQLQIERSDPEMTTYRIVEARLGYDPDGAPEHIIELMVRLEQEFGKEIALEIAALCNRHESDENQEQRLRRILNIPTQGLQGRFPDISIPSLPDHQLPEVYGRMLSREIRKATGISLEKNYEDSDLYGIFGLTENQTRNAPVCEENFSLCRRNNETLSLLFPKKSGGDSPLNRRFFMARLLGACLYYRKNCETFLPITDSKTWVQRMQRAFAAELLAPIESIRAMVDGNYSKKFLATVAETFRVRPELIVHSLLHHGDIRYTAAREWYARV